MLQNHLELPSRLPENHSWYDYVDDMRTDIATFQRQITARPQNGITAAPPSQPLVGSNDPAASSVETGLEHLWWVAEISRERFERVMGPIPSE